MPHKPSDSRDQRWLIDIAPRQMLPASEVIKFVAKEAVIANAGKLNDEFYGGDSDQDCRRINGARIALFCPLLQTIRQRS